jgi:ribosomal protein S18 acetylase RimI-like enzyme
MTIVRHATSADLPLAAGLAALEIGGEARHWQARFADALTKPGSCLVVAELSHQQIVGYGRVRLFAPPPKGPANIAPAGYYLGGVVVEPGHRRQGIGRQLTLERMDWAAARTGEIWYVTDAANQASVSLHERLGFREVTRDFLIPGVSFASRSGVLCRARLAVGSGTRHGLSVLA